MSICPSCKKNYPSGEKFCPEDGSPLPKTLVSNLVDTGPGMHARTPGGIPPGQKLPNPVDARLGSTIGNYQIIEKLGEGGMGAVYKASHPRIGREVAIKFLHPECAARPDVVERFFDEAKAANQIRNPHIIEISDLGYLPDGSSYLVMELLEGKDLKALLEEKGALSLQEFRSIFLQVCDALSAAHKAGIVHRDLKPENIFLCQEKGKDDFVKLVDFGIAKLLDPDNGAGKTRTGMLIGTPAYMSPEQAMGKRNIDARSDIYSLGVIFYESLSGSPPFRAESFGEILIKHATEPPVPLREFAPQKHFPPALDNIVQRCLAKEPAQRPANIEELLSALQNEATYQGGTLHMASPQKTIQKDGPPPGMAPKGSTPSVPGSASPANVPATMALGPPEEVIAKPVHKSSAAKAKEGTWVVPPEPAHQAKVFQAVQKPKSRAWIWIIVLALFGLLVFYIIASEQIDEPEETTSISFTDNNIAPEKPIENNLFSFPSECTTLKKRVCNCPSLAAIGGTEACQTMNLLESAYQLSLTMGEDEKDIKDLQEEARENCEEVLDQYDSMLRANGC